MTVHVFVDETKKQGILLAAAVVAARDLATTRAVMRQLRLRGQSRVHFTTESPRRRRQIASSICATNVVIDVYDATSIADAAEARSACLEQIVLDLSETGAHRLVIEQEDSMLTTDRKVLYRSVHRTGAQDVLTYEHLRPRDEPLLWIADAAAWCWSQGSSWRTRIRPAVRHVWVA